MYVQRRWTVPTPPSINLVSTTTCKIATEMCVVVSPRCYAVRSRPQVRHKCIVKSPLLLSTLVLISLYNSDYYLYFIYGIFILFLRNYLHREIITNVDRSNKDFSVH